MPLTFDLLSRVMVALAIAFVVVPLFIGDDKPAWRTALAAAVLVYFGSTLVYNYSSDWHWPAQGAHGEATPLTLDNLQARVREVPDDPQALALLGVEFLKAGRNSEAAAALERANELTGGQDADLQLALVDALMAASDDNRPRVNELVEHLLQRAPEHPKALLYGAELAFSRGELPLARERWQRLLERARGDQSEQARGVRDLLERRIELVDARLEGGAPPPAATGATADNGVLVNVSIDDALRERVPPGAVLFILARADGAAGPPLAVVRRNAAELPLSVRLSDANAMLPGRTMSKFDRVEFVARVSASGQPVAQAGDLFGAVTVSRPDTDEVVVKISNVHP